MGYPRWIQTIPEAEERQEWMAKYDVANPELRRVLDRGDDAAAALAQEFTAEELAEGADYFDRRRKGQLSLTERFMEWLNWR